MTARGGNTQRCKTQCSEGNTQRCKTQCSEVQRCKAAYGGRVQRFIGTAQHFKAQRSGVGNFPMMLLLLSARTLSSAAVNIGGVCLYHPTSVQGHDELESKAKLGKTSSQDGRFTSILIDHFAANGFEGESISSTSHEQLHTWGQAYFEY